MSDTLVCSAPARANLIGNPSDQYGGCTLACSVPLRARVRLEPAERFGLRSGEAVATLRGPEDLAPRGDELDLARGVLRAVGLEGPPAAIHTGTDIPRQSGLAGSTALVVALLRGLLAWRGEEVEPHALAERARAVERGELGVTCGYVDQYLCVFGGLRFVDFAGKTPDGGVPEEPFARVEALDAELPFLLANTGVRHSSDAVHRPIQERWRAGEAGVREAYRRVAAIGREGRRALEAGDWKGLGALMNENHAIQRDLGGSGEANERLVAAALEAGAPGAKLAGAGGGGTVVALWTDADAAPLQAALRAAGAAAFYRPAACAGVTLEPEPPAGSQEADPRRVGRGAEDRAKRDRS